MNYKIVSGFLIISIFFLFSCGNNAKLPENYFESPVPTIKQTQRKIPFGDLRDYQYCEVLPVFKNGDKIVTEVYNTISCNKCPDDKWLKLKADELKIKLGAKNVVLNGPRHWVINKAKVDSDVKYDKTASFGDIQIRLAAQIDGEIEIKKYSDVTVKRWTTWFYHTNNEVYKLVNPQGEEYIMQSYSRQVNRTQSIDDLRELGSKLQLPSGWTFKTEILDKDFELTAKGQAWVIQDDFGNTYQKITD